MQSLVALNLDMYMLAWTVRSYPIGGMQGLAHENNR